jgi:hypothetical protein
LKSAVKISAISVARAAKSTKGALTKAKIDKSSNIVLNCEKSNLRPINKLKAAVRYSPILGLATI